MKDKRLVDKAIMCAVNYHNGQKRKGSGDIIPYVSHPIEVMKLIAMWGVHDTRVLAAAVLHDIIEDTQMTESDLRFRFEDFVTDIVVELSSDDHRRDEERAIYIARRTAYLASFRKSSVESLVIKVADRLSNSWDYHNDGRQCYANKYFAQAEEVMIAFSKRKTEVSAMFGASVSYKIQNAIYEFSFKDDIVFGAGIDE